MTMTMTINLRLLALSTALGLTLSPAWAEVNIRYLSSQGGLSAFELADELGYFEGTGITFENVGYAQGGPASLVALAGGGVEIGSAATAAVLNSIAAGNDYVAAYPSNGINDEAESIFYVLEDSPIQSIQDIVGKTIAVNTLGARLDYVVRESLFQNGLPEDSANLIVVPGPQLEQVLRSGQVDISAFGYWQTTSPVRRCRMAGCARCSMIPTFWATSRAGSSCCAATGSWRTPRKPASLSSNRPGAGVSRARTSRKHARSLPASWQNVARMPKWRSSLRLRRARGRAGGRTRHPVLDRRCGTSGRRAAGPTGRRRHPLCDGRWPGHQLKAGQMGEVDTIRRGEVTVRDLSKSFALNGQRLNVLRNLSLDIRGERRWPSSALGLRQDHASAGAGGPRDPDSGGC